VSGGGIVTGGGMMGSGSDGEEEGNERGTCL